VFFLSDILFAEDLDELRRRNIHHVLSVCFPCAPQHEKGFVGEVIELDDVPFSDLLSFFPLCFSIHRYGSFAIQQCSCAL